MTIQEIIDRVSEYKGAIPDTELLIRQMNDIENRIKKNIVDKCEDGSDYPFERYTSADYNTEVIAPEPYTDVYVWYLIYMIDVRAGSEAQQTTQTRYRQAYEELAAYWTREHMPLQGKRCHSDGFGI